MHDHLRSKAVRGPLALSAVLVLAAGCVSSGDEERERETSDGPWLEASLILEQQISDEAARLPWTHGIEKLEQIRWFAGVGEPAYPKLLELAQDEREHVAAAALAALGATGDKRLVPYIRDIEWDSERRSRDLELERGRALMRLGDWSHVPLFVEGLRDERLYTRALCAKTLSETTQLSFGYDPRADESARETAIRKWNEWLLARTQEGLLAAQP